MPVHISAYMRLARSIATVNRELDAMDTRLELIERTICPPAQIRVRPPARIESDAHGAAD